MTDLPVAGEVSLADELRAILPDPNPGGWLNSYLKVARLADGTGYELAFGQMYEPPDFGLAEMKALAALFGVADEDLDVDNYSQGGCETCDYGSQYGHTVQLRRPTKWVDELAALVGEDLYDAR